MSDFKEFLKSRLPPVVVSYVRGARSIPSRIKCIFTYSQYDSSVYWRNRARGTGQSRVLWRNEDYNQLFRKCQREILAPYLHNLSSGDILLDIGCGIGIVAKMMAEIRPDVHIDAVDYPEMVAVAQKENQADQIHYIAQSAESYLDPAKKYRFIISSACFSAIKEVERMETAMDNCLKMLASGGIILLIDPFHRWNYLARVKYSSRQVIRFINQRNAELIEKSGVLFWPYRDWICSSSMKGEQLEKKFLLGEKLLHILGAHLWADYKILAFQKA